MELRRDFLVEDGKIKMQEKLIRGREILIVDPDVSK